MGSCCSSELDWTVNENIPGQGQRTVNIAKSLGINEKDLSKLFKAFVQYDKVRLASGGKHQGKEDVEEYLKTEGITTKEIAHHLAKKFYSQSGLVNFEEFVVTSWWIVSLDEEEVAKWIFRLFKSDDDDKMTPTEMKHLVEIIGSHHPNSMKGLEECYKHLCFEKVEQQQKPKGPLYYGKPMEPQDPSDNNPKYITQEKLFITLVDFSSEISKKRSVLKPIHEMQAMLREKTVGSRFFEWRAYRQKTFGSNLTLDEIKECLDIETKNKSQPMIQPGKPTSRVFPLNGTQKDSGDSFVVVEEQDQTGNPHRYHPEKRPSSITPRSTKENHRRSSGSLNPSSSHNASNRTPHIITPRDNNMEPNRRSSASLNQSTHNASNRTPRSSKHNSNRTPRSSMGKEHQPTTHQPTTASSSYPSNRDSLRTNTPRSSKDNDRPTSASSNHSSHQHHTPRSSKDQGNKNKDRPTSASSNHSSHHHHTPRSKRKNDRATFPAPYREKDYRSIIESLEDKEWGEVMN